MVIFRRQIVRFRLATLCLSAIGLASGLMAQSDFDTNAPGLVERSPFLPPDMPPPRDRAEAVKPAVAPGAYEFRGFYAINGKVRMLVKHKSEPAGLWLRLHETQNGRTVKAFDAEERSILLDADGTEVRLSLATLDSNSTPMPINGQPAVGAQAGVSGGTVRPTRVQAPVVRRGTANSPVARRRVAPARPQWLQDRLDAQNAAAGGRALANSSQQTLPNRPVSPADLVTPGPPPTTLPPTPPPTGIPELPDFLNASQAPSTTAPGGGTPVPEPGVPVLPEPPVFPGMDNPPY